MSSPLPSILIILAPFPLFELSLPLLSDTCLLYYITVVYFPTFPYLTQTYFFEHLKWWLHFFLTSVYLSNRKCSLSIWKLNSDFLTLESPGGNLAIDSHAWPWTQALRLGPISAVQHVGPADWDLTLTTEYFYWEKIHLGISSLFWL